MPQTSQTNRQHRSHSYQSHHLRTCCQQIDRCCTEKRKIASNQVRLCLPVRRVRKGSKISSYAIKPTKNRSGVRSSFLCISPRQSRTFLLPNPQSTSLSTKASGCRVCIEIGHPKNDCQVLDLYNVADPQKYLNPLEARIEEADISEPLVDYYRDHQGHPKNMFGLNNNDDDDDDLVDDSDD